MELLGVVGRQELARAVVRATTPDEAPIVLEPAVSDDRQLSEGSAACLTLEIETLEWWEREPWNEIPDEWRIWDDPSPQTQRLAAELLRNIEMDT